MTVRDGETLSSIARDHATTWQALWRKNLAVVGPNPDRIFPGQHLAV